MEIEKPVSPTGGILDIFSQRATPFPRVRRREVTAPSLRETEAGCMMTILVSDSPSPDSSKLKELADG